MNATDLRERALAAAAARRWPEADLAAWQSLEIFAREAGPESIEVARLSNLLARIAEGKAQFAAAEHHARRAWGIMLKLGDSYAGSEANAIRADARLRLGSALRAAGRYREAEGWLMQAVAFAESTGSSLADALEALGELCSCTGEYSKAERLYRRALGMLPNNSTEVATLHRKLAELAHAQGRAGQGEPDARRAWEIHRRLLGSHHPETLADVCAYASLIETTGRGECSSLIYRHAIVRFERANGSESLEVAGALHKLARVLGRRGAAHEAEALYRRAAAIREKLLGGSHPDTALIWHDYAAMLANLDRIAEARHVASRSLQVFEVDLPPSHPWRIAARQLWELLRRQPAGESGGRAQPMVDGARNEAMAHV
jgi:tetratricopeptide (TPR) repeat protein